MNQILSLFVSFKFLDDFTYLSVGLILIILNVLAVSLVDVIKPLANIHAEWLAYVGFGPVFISFLMYILKTNAFEKGKEKWNTYIRIGAVATTIVQSLEHFSLVFQSLKELICN